MQASGVVETLPSSKLDDDALSAVRMVLRHGLPGLVAVDGRGEVVGCASSVDLLHLALPRYLAGEPVLARTVDEGYADRIGATFAGVRVADVVAQAADRVPTARPCATLVELAELMARHRCPLVLVRDDTGVVGIVTANGLLAVLLTDAGEPSP